VAATFFGKPETLMEGGRPAEFENPGVASHQLWQLFSFQMSAFSFDGYEVPWKGGRPEVQLNAT
jgi:hypothetical protein